LPSLNPLKHQKSQALSIIRAGFRHCFSDNASYPFSGGHMSFTPFQSVPFLALKGFVSSKAVKVTASAIAGAAWGATAAETLGVPPWQGAVIGAPIGAGISLLGGETGSWAPVFVSALFPYAAQYVADHIGLPPELTSEGGEAIMGSFLNFYASCLGALLFRDAPKPEWPVVEPLPVLKGAKKSPSVALKANIG